MVGRTEGWVGAIPDQHGTLKAFFRKERIGDSRYRPEEYKKSDPQALSRQHKSRSLWRYTV